jgi:hypothetical protein
MVHKFEDKHCMIHGSYPGMLVYCPTCPQPPLTGSDIAKIEAMEAQYKESEKPSVKLTIDCNFEVREAIKYALPKGAILPELGTQITILWRKDEL